MVDKPAGVPSQPTLTSDRGHLPELVSRAAGRPGAASSTGSTGRRAASPSSPARADAERVLADAFRDGTPEKTYLALCARAPEPAEGRIDAPLGKDPRHPGRAGRRSRAATRPPPATAPSRSGPGGAALVEARPETGRTHQIRVHLAHLGRAAPRRRPLRRPAHGGGSSPYPG